MNTISRCPWCGSDPLYVKYHDEERGVPVHEDNVHFEFLVLEGAQAGLSWFTVLKKREKYRELFASYNVEEISNYDEKKVHELMQNPGIIRNKLKINSVIKNAKAFLEVQKEFGSFDAYIRGFVDGKQIVNNFRSMKEYVSHTDLSDVISKNLKKRGFSFVGSTIVYAYMQAIGMVNDHMLDCDFRFKKI